MTSSVHPSITSAPISYTLMVRLRARNMARRAERALGLPVDAPAVERAVAGVYRSTGSRRAAIDAMRQIATALEQHAGQGGDAA